MCIKIKYLLDIPSDDDRGSCNQKFTGVSLTVLLHLDIL